MEILDDEGNKSELATLAEDGHTIIGRGGTGMGYVSADGLWCDKSQLQPVDLNGQPITPVGSSFAAPVLLTEPSSADDYLQHTIRSLYSLEGTEPGLLGAQLRSGAIFKFSYSYRGGLEADVAFLLANDAGELFMAVGSATAIDYVGLQQAAGIAADDTEDDAEDGDDMDFNMI